VIVGAAAIAGVIGAAVADMGHAAVADVGHAAVAGVIGPAKAAAAIAGVMLGGEAARPGVKAAATVEAAPGMSLQRQKRQSGHSQYQ
jgi:hypothetical protein